MKKFLLFFICSFYALCANEQFIVIIIPSYNNIQWYEKNLSSVLNQNYENFIALYFDDASIDGTSEAAPHYLKQYDTHNKIKYIRNESRRGALANHWHGVHMCNPNDIIVNLDGDDWFAHTNVLATINNAYADNRTAATYGQYIEYPSMQKGHCRPLSPAIIQQNAWRRVPLPLPTSHVRTFKAGLFQNIKLEDFLIHGDFFPTAGDVAFFFPILEQAGRFVKFIPDILYVYNNDTPINDYKVRLATQLNCFQIIRNKKPYTPLFWPVEFELPSSPKIGICLIGSDAETKIDITKKYIQDFAFLCTARSTHEMPLHEGFDYVLLIPDHYAINKNLDILSCISMMKKTHVNYCYIDYHVNNGITLFNRFNAWTYKGNELPSGPVLIKVNKDRITYTPPAGTLCISCLQNKS